MAACRSCGITRQPEAQPGDFDVDDCDRDDWDGRGSAARDENGERFAPKNAPPEGQASSRCDGNGQGQRKQSEPPSGLPFANLRERTFDMTKRGQLTSANVWYASRKDRDFVRGSSRGGGVAGVRVAVPARGEEGGGGEVRPVNGDQDGGQGRCCSGAGGGGGSDGGVALMGEDMVDVDEVDEKL